MNYSKIGIRTTIEGCESGVRESLKKQVMAMARSAADFISSHHCIANIL